MKNRIKQLWQEREIRSFAVLAVVILTLLLLGPFFSDTNPLADLDNRLILIFVLVLVWGTFNWWQLNQDKRLSQHKELAGSNDELHVACAQIKQNVAAAVEFLKQRLSHNIASWRAFHTIPWYLVIGNVSSGKTRLLAESELGFLEVDQFVQFTPPGSSTTGKVNWWFAPSAVMIDVPGNYLANSQTLTPNRVAWLELLRQIKHYRWRRPINGVVVVLDVETILNLSHDTSHTALTLMRARLQEIMHRLKQPVPVYLICSQADKVQGFHEYFDDLGKSERQENWGITFPLKSKLNASELFNKAFDHFILNLHQRVLWRIHHERDRAKCYLIQQFPQQLNFLRENLQRIVYDFSTLGQQVSLRGIYFTSAEMQTEKTIDNIGDTVSKQFSLLPVKRTSVASRPQQAFFVKQVFDKQIFPEAALANHTLLSETHQRDKLLRLSALGLAAIIIVSAVITWSKHYQHQTAHLNTATVALSDYKLLAITFNPSANTSLDKLLPALNALRLAQDNAAQADLPWLLRFQLHRQQPLSIITNQLYQHDLQTRFIPSVRDVLAQQLRDNTAVNSTQLYDLLKTYLMLGDPTHLDKNYLQQWFVQEWQNPLAKDNEFMLHLNAALANTLVPGVSDDNTIVQARAALNALPYNLLSYAIFQSNLPTGNFQPVNLQQKQNSFILPQTAIPQIYSTSQLVQIDALISNSLASAINGNWVLGNKQSNNISAQTIESLRQGLINNYAQDYSSAWQGWFNQIQLKPINSLAQLDLMLQELSSQSSPLTQLLNVIASNTTMTGTTINDSVLITALQNNLTPHFAALNVLQDEGPANGVHLRDILAALQQVQQQIHFVAHNKNSGQAALQILQNDINAPSKDAINQLSLLAKQVPQPIQGWLMNLADNSRHLLMQQAQVYLAKQWQQQIMPFYNTKIANCFPLQANALNTISIKDFQTFFQKDGLLDHYVTTNLAPFIDTTQAKWQWRLINGQPIIQNTNLLAQIERANIIQKLYFDKNNNLVAPFNLELISTSPMIKSVQLSIDKQKITELPTASHQHHFTWPTTTGDIQLSLIDQQGKLHTLSASGDWALFKLLSRSQLKPLSDGQSYEVWFTIDGYKAVYHLTAASPLNPFIPGVIDQFALAGF